MSSRSQATILDQIPRLQAVFGSVEAIAPGIACAGMVVDLEQALRDLRHGLEFFRREGEVKHINMAVGQRLGGNALSVTGRQIARGIPETTPGRIGGAETIRAVAVVNDEVVGTHRLSYGERNGTTSEFNWSTVRL